MEILIRVIGWLGSIMVLAAFILVGRKWITPESKTSAVLNLVGAAFLGINTYWFSAYPSAALNLVWAGIALWNLVSYRVSKPLAATPHQPSPDVDPDRRT